MEISTDVHRHLEVWWFDAKMLSVVSRKGAWWGHLLWVHVACITAHCQTNAEHYFITFCFLFIYSFI